jgi:hypothetical protein
MKPQFIIIGILGILFLFVITRPRRVDVVEKQVPVPVPILKKVPVPVKVPVYKQVRFAEEQDPIMYLESGEYERDDFSRYLGGFPYGIDLEAGTPLYKKMRIGSQFYNGSYKTYTS